MESQWFTRSAAEIRGTRIDLQERLEIYDRGDSEPRWRLLVGIIAINLGPVTGDEALGRFLRATERAR